MVSLDVKPFATQWFHAIQSHVAVSLGVSVLSIAAFLFWPSKPNNVPALPGVIPYLSTTYLYMTDMRSFLTQASQALSLNKIVWFYLGPMKVYLVTGARNVQIMFRSSTSVSSDKFMIIIMENVFGMSKADLSKFANDRSGRLAKPAPGSENQRHRYWRGYHHVIEENLARTVETNKLAESYRRLFEERLERYPVGEWTTVGIFDFIRKDMAEAAIISLSGTRIFELNPDLLTRLWEFDEVAGSLAWGLPRWLQKEACERQARFKEVCDKYLESAWANFDWDGPDADSDWEPNFGARFSRELAKWMKECEFDAKSCSGMMAVTTLYGQNGNTTPVAAWGVIEVVKDPSLFEAVRKEVITAYVTDPITSERTLDMQKLLSLPLLQSIYAEVMRLHVSINVTREVMEPVMVDGHMLEKGSLLQAPSEIAHYEESVWGATGHPASEFWAARHINEVEVTDNTGKVTKQPRFSMAGRSNDWLPYGGGISMCPGRFFAKQEIMMTIAMLVARFDIEFIEWTNLDGTPSDRAAQNDVRWAGGASVPPDREMKVRWKRLW